MIKIFAGIGMGAICRIRIAEMQSGKIQKVEKDWVQGQNAL